MDFPYWHKQTAQEPLFPNLLWSRPENRKHAGKLLIIGGHLHEFTAPALAYNEASKAGAGTARVILPQALEKTVGTLVPEALFAPTTPSGSFATAALDDIMTHAEWADGVLLAGSFGKNSETAIMLETFAQKYTGQLTLTKDAIDYFAKSPQALLARPNTTLVLSLAQFQQIATHSQSNTPITFSMDLVQLISTLHEFTQTHQVHIVTRHHDVIYVASAGQISTTPLPQDYPKVWRVETATHSATWWLQNPTNPFEALTTSVLKP